MTELSTKSVGTIDQPMLANRVILVTGASRGIGAATAKLLAAHGAKVIVNYNRSAREANNVVEHIKAHGGTALAVKADVNNEAEVKKMIETAVEHYSFIDTTVLNASPSFSMKSFIDHSWNDFEKKLVGELKSAFFICKEVVPPMVQKRKGNIIAISTGLSRHPVSGFIAHSSAKAALDAFVRSLAFELGPHGIRVNVIAPGLVETDATAFMSSEQKDTFAQAAPLRRVAMPEDIAGAVLLLASTEARFITGAYLPVNGGTQMV